MAGVSLPRFVLMCRVPIKVFNRKRGTDARWKIFCHPNLSTINSRAAQKNNDDGGGGGGVVGCGLT